MNFIPEIVQITPFLEEIVSFVTVVGGIVTTLFVKDKKRKDQLREIINDVQTANDVFMDLAKKKNLKGAAKEIEKLLK